MSFAPFAACFRTTDTVKAVEVPAVQFVNRNSRTQPMANVGTAKTAGDYPTLLV